MGLIRTSAKLYLGIYAAIMALAFYLAGTVTQDDLLTGAVGAMILFPPFFLPVAIWRLVFRPKQRFKGGLDRVLFKWPGNSDSFTVRHLVQSLVVFGLTGSGKSSGSGLLVSRAILSIPSGGVILASKPEDREWWEQRFKEAGRPNDLIIFAEDTSARCNFIEFEMKSGGDARSLAQFLTVTSEVLDSGKGKPADPYWKKSEERWFYNIISALMQGGEPVTAPNIARFLTTAAYNPETLKDKDWREKFHNQVLEKAFDKVKTEREQADFDLFYPFWTTEFPQQDDKPRSSILSGVNNTLFIYNTGVVHEKISTTTTTTPEDLAQGKWWLFDYSYHRYGNSGKFLMAAAKFIVQKYCLRRKASPNDIPILIHADECQNVLNSYDGVFLAESRSHMSGMIYLTQSLHSFMNAME